MEHDIRTYFQHKYREPEVMNDLAQETYMRLLKSLPAVQEPMKLRSFVVKVAVHVSQDYLRQKYRRREDTLEEHFESSTDHGASAGQAAISTSSENMLSQIDLERALAELPEKTRQILLLKADGYRYEEIAAELDLSEVQTGFATRGVTEERLGAALRAFAEQHYDAVAEQLDDYLHTAPENTTRDQAHYFAGLARLAQAKSEFFRRFQNYDQTLIDQGIRHLQVAAASDNLRLKEEALWFLGKAALMKRDRNGSKAALEQVHALRGSRKDQAANLLRQLQQLAGNE